jgi:hypothetical protein
MSSADKVYSEESNGNEETPTDNKGAVVEEVQAESHTINCKGNNQEDKSLSQQSTQEYVPTEKELKVEKGKYEETEVADAKTSEICREIKETGKKEHGSTSYQVTHIISNKGSDSSNIIMKPDEKDCDTSFIEHSEERMDQCFVQSKHTHNNSSQVSTKVDVATKQDTKDNSGETSRDNSMNKPDNMILSSDKYFLTQNHSSSDCEDDSKIKPNSDSIMLQIQNLTYKSPAAPPQYTCSIKTLIGNEEESPLPLDILLKNTMNHPRLIWDTTEEMKPTKIQPMSQATSTVSISEQKSRGNKCEGADVSVQIVKAQDETDKNNHLTLVTEEAQEVSNFGNELVTKCEESTFTSSLSKTDPPVNISEVNLDETIQNTALSPSVATKDLEICNAGSTVLQRYAEQGDRGMATISQFLDTATQKILLDTNLDLNSQSETSKIAPNTGDMKTAMLNNHKEAENIKTKSHSLDAAKSDSQKIKNPPESQITAANKCIEEHFTERYVKASNTVAFSNRNKKNEPAGSDLSCSKHPAKDTEENGVNVENTEPPNAGCPSSSNMEESVPKQNEINQTKAAFNKFKDILCKSPTTATEAPNIYNMVKVNEESLCNKNIPDTASHGYLLDDDIGLTGSQLLRIEDECQYNFQSTKEAWNLASSCGEARVPDIAVSEHIPPTPNWSQCVLEKRQKLRSVIQDISRLK